MKWSKYNILFKAQTEDNYLLFNTMSNSVLKLDSNNAKILMDIKAGNLKDTELDPVSYEELVQRRILVNDDDIELAKFKLLKQYNRMDSNSMSLTIAPTMACNLHCSYCFENSHPKIHMDDSVEDAIIAFIKGHKTIEHLHVSWFGGEPLLAFPRIISLTRKMLALPNVKRYEAEIITNGVNMDEKKAKALESLKINTVHVTIDGLGEAHNIRRKGSRGEDTFSKILNGLDILSHYDGISKTIRVNVDKNNPEQFNKVYEMIRQRYRSLNFNTYIGFIKESYGCGNSCTGCYSNEEQASYIISTYQKLGIPTESLLPIRYNFECIARQKNGLLIGPDGWLYKCWTDLGNEKMRLGNIKKIDQISLDLLAEYMVGADPFCDIECQKCILLPFCGGGCPHSRIMNKFYGTNNNCCHFAKDHIEEFVETYFKLKQQIF